MASATPAVDVLGRSTSLPEEMEVWGLRLLCGVAESGRRGDRSLEADDENAAHAPAKLQVDVGQVALSPRADQPGPAVTCVFTCMGLSP